MDTEKSVESDDASARLVVHLQEYEKLKDEQIARIGFRDNLIYVTLGVFGGILSFSLTDAPHHYALLLLPWASLVLGWTYLVNDEKVSALGKYIRHELTGRIMECKNGDSTGTDVLGWEIAHRSDGRRVRRKIEQLVVDELTFVVSGLAALVAFRALAPQAASSLVVLLSFEALLLLALGVEVFLHADLRRGA